jgi:cyanophycinase-like exopeptidase
MLMKFIYSLFLLFLLEMSGFSQGYSSSISGDTSNFIGIPQKKLCLMGGATEDDNAIQWWLSGAAAGDVVVIRVTGSLTSYNTYFTSSIINTNLNSVETILIPSIAAANDPYVKRRLREAEAIWITGGNQNLYRTYWKNTAVDSAINWAYNVKGTCIGGTSAGMMIQGQFYYYAGNSSVTSVNALANPYNMDMTIAYNDFLHIPFLNNVITDTHFDNPDRRGRLMAFLARNTSSTNRPLAIACDEYTAVCIDSNGLARVFGGAPTYSDNAYFLQVNCALPNTPETMQSGAPLSFNRNGEAVKVYHVLGNSSGTPTFDLKNWQTATGGNWENWMVQNGTFNSSSSNNANTCLLNTNAIIIKNTERLFYIQNGYIRMHQPNAIQQTSLIDMQGQVVKAWMGSITGGLLDVSQLPKGLYFIRAEFLNQIVKQKLIID